MVIRPRVGTKAASKQVKAHLNKQIYECGAHQKQRTEVGSVFEGEGGRDGWADKQLQFLSTTLCNSLPTRNCAGLYGHVQILGNTSCSCRQRDVARARAHTHA